MEDILTDLFAHQFADDPKAAEEVEDDDFNPDDVARQIGAEPPADDWEDLA